MLMMSCDPQHHQATGVQYQSIPRRKLRTNGSSWFSHVVHQMHIWKSTHLEVHIRPTHDQATCVRMSLQYTTTKHTISAAPSPSLCRQRAIEQ